MELRSYADPAGRAAQEISEQLALVLADIEGGDNPQLLQARFVAIAHFAERAVVSLDRQRERAESRFKVG